ncbi:hypothetical protein GUITHDRAFT_113459 [Guillardia theta CCMP2712]|uniref:Protein kinase domain-containing protein n=1 Tax=Guillardia theta (strain CCMP2712) TaxID=905079 RepID=L1IX47_GUITC|nr:hypothetical protein GUITHDRAFT_113459 [Guillardia theta CCMP2712]EKX40430.1 hypothetical protein GUITHDRAFT_113459 [Guillardia theta CCMP2712]|eukprot:XP_005827410.1 hypothetical protein GUITHDRAFT_113459 [Guillardia theta CCMP2712]
MHASKIIHRDIKPQNVMVDELGRAKYIDFGLSKEEELSRQTSASYTMVGTQSWMAPEVKKGEKATAASDVYSFGLVGKYVLLFGGGQKLPDDIYGKMVAYCTCDNIQRRPTSGIVATSLMAKQDLFPSNAYCMCDNIQRRPTSTSLFCI